MRVHNVRDRRCDFICSWETEPLDVDKLTEADVGRTVIYQSYNNAEAGTLVAWKGRTVFAIYHKGDTAAGANADDLCFGISRVNIP